MGGAVAVTVRMPDHQEFRMHWGTGAIEGIIQAPGFLTLDPQFWDWPECFERWRSSERAYELSPIDYGLVVVDFVTKRIISVQDYHVVGSYHISGLDPDGARATEYLAAMVAQGHSVSLRRYVRHQERKARYGRYGVMRDLHADFEHWSRTEPLAEYGATVSEAVSAIYNQRARDDDEDRGPTEALVKSCGALPWRLYDFVVDLHPFKVDTFRDATADKWRTVKAELSDMGFTLSDKEEASWARRIADTANGPCVYLYV